MNISWCSPATPWCSPAGCWAQRTGHRLNPYAVSWKRPLRICRTLRTQMRSCTSTWTSRQWSSVLSVVVTLLGGHPHSAWRAWTLWPQWKSTTPTAMSSVRSMRPTGPSLTPWKAWTCQCHPPQPRCLYRRPSTPLPTLPELPHQLLSCWRTGKGPENCPGNDGLTLNLTTKVCHTFTPFSSTSSSLLLLTVRSLMCPHTQYIFCTNTLKDIPRESKLGIIPVPLSSIVSTFPSEYKG